MTTRSPNTIVGDPQAWNRYAYILGNPPRYTDPSGHCITEDDGHEYEDGWRQTGDSIYECTVYQFIDMPEWLRGAWFSMIFGDGQQTNDSPQAILNFLDSNPALRDPLEKNLGMFLRPALACTLAMTKRWGCATGGGGRVSNPPAEQGLSVADPAACGAALAGYANSVGTDIAFYATGGSSALLWMYDYHSTGLASVASIAATESTAPGVQEPDAWIDGSINTGLALANIPVLGSLLSWSQAFDACAYG